MATEFRLPKLGMGMVEAEIVEWSVADGAQVEEGQPVVVIQTDKVDNTLESPASGTIRILVPEGEVIEVGVVMATIG